MSPKMILGLVFVLEYVFLVFSKRFRAASMWVAVGVTTLVGVFTLPELVTSIHWNVIAIFIGTFLIAEVVIYSKMPVLLADILVDKSTSISGAILWICLLASVISAFVENVATVLIVAPVALEIARQQKVSPVPFLIGIAISSNLQGTATLIGDPPSMILAAHKKLTFNDFFFYEGNFSIFWGVQVGAVLSFIVLYFIYKKNKQRIVPIAVEKVKSWVPTILITAMIVGLAVSSKFDPDFHWLAGTICLVFGVISVLWMVLQDRKATVEMLKGYDFETTFFLMGIFVMIAGLVKWGIVDDAAVYLQSVMGTNVFWIYTIIVFASVAFSAVIDNVPYIMTMLPIVSVLSKNLGVEDTLLVFGLLIGACLGGNITPIGASANIVSVGLLKKNGYETSFWEFVKIGFPFTIAATIGGYIFVWLVWA